MADSILILGAMSGIAKSCAKRYAARGYDLVLAARNLENLEGFATHLRNEFAVEVKVLVFDALDFDGHKEFVQGLNGLPDIAIVAFGVLGDQKILEKDVAASLKSVDTNFKGAVSITAHLANAYEEKGNGTIVGICSVAGNRGRKKNYVYGSAKAGYANFLSGLRQRMHGTDVHVITVKPGFVDTPMTSGMETPAFLTVSADEMARVIDVGVTKKKYVIYSSISWRLIMFVIESLPEFIFKRLSF